jgi:hypothetical protein
MTRGSTPQYDDRRLFLARLLLSIISYSDGTELGESISQIHSEGVVFALVPGWGIGDGWPLNNDD